MTLDVAASEAPPSASNNSALSAWTLARTVWRRGTYWWGLALLLFAATVVMAGIVTRANNPPWSTELVPWGLDVFLFWIMLAWVAMLEGCQISIVGLQAYDPEAFKETHPRAYKSCKLVLAGANVERFLVGRQFLLLFNGFLISRIGGGGPISNFVLGGWVWDFFVTQVFFSNGVLLMIVIVALGQLPTQLIAADKMLGFFDLPLGHYYFVVLPCLAVESIGLTHSSYLLKDLLCLICKIDQSEANPTKRMNKDIWHYLKCALSVTAVIFSATLVTKGIALGQTNATAGPGWDGLPGAAAVVISLLFIFMLGCAEGLQVSLIALIHVPISSFKAKSPLASRTCEIAFSGMNLHAFLVGRQFLTAMNMVLLGRVTAYSGSEGVLMPGGDWGFGPGFNAALLQTGFLGAILVVNVAQLASQVTASIFPTAVINNHVMLWTLRLTLLIEFLGIVNGCWLLTWMIEKAFGMVPDPEQYRLGAGASAAKVKTGAKDGDVFSPRASRLAPRAMSPTPVTISVTIEPDDDDKSTCQNMQAQG